MKTLIMALSCLFLISACSSGGDGGLPQGNPVGTIFAEKAVAVTQPNSFIGIWETSPITENGVTFVIRLKLDTNRITGAARCNLPGGEVLFTQVETRASYSRGFYRIEKPVEKTTSKIIGEESYSCSIELPKMILRESSIENGILKDGDVVLRKISELPDPNNGEGSINAPNTDCSFVQNEAARAFEGAQQDYTMIRDAALNGRKVPDVMTRINKHKGLSSSVGRLFDAQPACNNQGWNKTEFQRQMKLYIDEMQRYSSQVL